MSLSVTKRKRPVEVDSAPDELHLSDASSVSQGIPDTQLEHPPKKVKRHVARPTIQKDGANGLHFGEAYRSNMFKLQMDQLLQQMKLDTYSSERRLAELLQSLKSLILGIPDVDAMTVSSCEALLIFAKWCQIKEAETYIKKQKVAIPFPNPRPKLDANYKLAFKKPASVNVTGSYATKTMVKGSASNGVDFVVTMPQSLFQEKDFLNHRYFLKRSFYVSCIAAALGAQKGLEVEINFDYLNGNHLLPILQLRPISKHKSIKDWIIQIIPSIPLETFGEERLEPGKNCVRSQADGADAEGQKLKPTPFYNASIMVDSSLTSYLKLQHDTLKLCPSLLDATILGRIWLRQRGFGSCMENGGFGNFEWLTISSLLLRGGGPKNAPLFSQGYNCYQLFKAMIQFLATRDLIKDPVILGTKSSLRLPRHDGTPYFFDGQRYHNVVYKMSPWSYRMLQHDAAVSLAALADASSDQFENMFISKSDYPLCRYDAVLEIPVSAIKPQDKTLARPLIIGPEAMGLYKVLSRALGNRILGLNIQLPHLSAWETSLEATAPSAASNIVVGFMFNEAHINRTVDRGPSAQDPKEAASFRRFWAEKAELRRFKDGSIVETVVWSPSSSSVFRQIVTYSISKQYGQELGDSLRLNEGTGQLLLPKRTSREGPEIDGFRGVIAQLRSLEEDIRALDNMPLHLRQIQAADPQLSYSSIRSPCLIDSKQYHQPAEIVIQFEGSARWPDDIDAIQRTKIAFLLKLGELLERSNTSLSCRVGLENTNDRLLNKAVLDIMYPAGFCFRVRIHHDREATLLDRMLKDKNQTSQEKLDAASALHIYKGTFISQPAHTMAVQHIAIQYPSFSETVRLVKTWFSSHRLLKHFHESVIELFVARVHRQASPWSPPVSSTSGLLRTLLLLSRWDWRHEPWIATLGTESMNETEIAAITTRFNAWRKIDPGLNRVVLFAASNVNTDGATWTDYAKPSKVVAARMTALARSAVETMKEQGPQLDLDAIFSSSLSDYDFTIQIDRDIANGIISRSKKDNSKFRNMQLQQTMDTISVGFDPVAELLIELQALFGEVVMLFFDEIRRDVIAGIWNPHTRRQWKLKLGYSSMPVGKADETEVNRDSVLNEIARLGGGLIRAIGTKSKKA